MPAVCPVLTVLQSLDELNGFLPTQKGLLLTKVSLRAV